MTCTLPMSPLVLEHWAWECCPSCGCMTHNAFAVCHEPWHEWWRARHGISWPTDTPPTTCLADGGPGEWPRWDDRPFEALCDVEMWAEHEREALAGEECSCP